MARDNNMRRLLPLLAVALCLAALCAVHVTEVLSQERRYPEPPSPTIPKPSPPGAAKQVLEALSGLSQSLENGDITDISPDDLARHFKAAAAMQGASNVVADVLEDPRVGFQTSGEVSAKVHKLFNAKLEKEGGTVKGGLENKFLGLTIDGTPGDRKIGATFTIGTGNLHGTYEFKRQFSVEFSYRNNEDYVRAMGIDAGNIPGARTVLTLMNRMSGTIQPEDKSPPPAGAMDAALGQIKSMLPPIFEAGAKFETATFGNAVSVTRDGVELSFTKKERIRPGDPQAPADDEVDRREQQQVAAHRVRGRAGMGQGAVDDAGVAREEVVRGVGPLDVAVARRVRGQQDAEIVLVQAHRAVGDDRTPDDGGALGDVVGDDLVAAGLRVERDRSAAHEGVDEHGRLGGRRDVAEDLRDQASLAAEVGRERLEDPERHHALPTSTNSRLRARCSGLARPVQCA